MLKQKKGPAFLLKTFDMLQVSHSNILRNSNLKTSSIGQFKEKASWSKTHHN